ncbi:hypothetical protein A2962_02230 [Candidatus Woesebacteria bacterium RIFCSPLOWO2_01_FULL_39_61]|uniref:2TM domain-containing protein n=1 Tax=Candidatus Woesebacteria bacterium RIFCSPHIGHO2_02_FULL_39_13 TaxID=1802505 RepID=A0A1F7Z4Z4_9BACT|nr:MAG: hypothetical protein A2692_01245 [Candidatus Woesebacteria bacterium RIFCSPHIGHO2_01_FULL_39_95]OGM33978.1 MAG: hypothetical protein A3D01_03535 [Candidatus Woesebacteria bacterium RIFCSPHIGHO2_02_FULL_39_13]OGM38236.1 MAG: hypothetical protein A3E13_05645 [Candidatus Woesebacteria bacterium RIFCSPHIGHO2_12_FULL_40_20]OGM66942.1 MAG: hypothetical protein A2962_02230 [Candidatus Woesebacteria bacterium RIFCSPLOWO2_01_FULL_39_61]OGM72302.1 MAG: hypothetical protein A3H19_03320 [Candidatus
MDRVGRLEEKIEKIDARNKRVEADKDWEVSYTRRILLFVFTYISIGLYLNAIQIPNPWLNAIVPSIGFLLSTLTLPYFKSIWFKKRSKKI